MENNNQNIQKTKVISIITVVYNAYSLLEATIKSVLNQTYRENIEFAIIDGASTDGTLDIIEKYRNQVEYFISEKDLGIYDAMNKGILTVKGDYILFLNAGDEFYSKNVLSEVSGYLDNNIDVLYGNTYVKKENMGRVVRSYSLKDDWKTIPYCHQSVFIKRVLLRKNLFDLDFKIAADYNQYHSLKRQKSIFKSIDTVISIYDDMGYSSMNIKMMLVEYKQISLKNATGFLTKLKVRLYFFLRSNLRKY